MTLAAWKLTVERLIPLLKDEDVHVVVADNEDVAQRGVCELRHALLHQGLNAWDVTALST